VQKEGVVGFCVLAYLETSIERSNCSRLCAVVSCCWDMGFRFRRSTL